MDSVSEGDWSGAGTAQIKRIWIRKTFRIAIR
jgi:hypothetical protein